MAKTMKKLLIYKFSAKYTNAMRKRILDKFPCMRGNMPLINPSTMTYRRIIYLAYKDPEMIARMQSGLYQSNDRILYSAKGYANKQKHGKNVLHSPDVREKRAKIANSPEHKARMKKKMRDYWDRVRANEANEPKEKNVQIVDRVNDYCGVLTEKDFENL